VIWVPTPQETVELMLNMAKLTKEDFHMDLGSGDGRTVITAAKRGARSMGIEYNPDMVALSNENAKAAGVTARVEFIQADLLTDFEANVLTLFCYRTSTSAWPEILDMRWHASSPTPS
jgi:tRNA/tmRNA/rRNA uracil-C5-methylase (TrmA/RlmC/RlmD family)